MLATRWPEAFDDEDWWFEVKWDGYRAIVGREQGKVRARSRRGLNLIEPFPELGDLPIPDGVILDGEIVVFDEEGLPSFSMLQRRTVLGGQGTGTTAGVNLVAPQTPVWVEPGIVISVEYKEWTPDYHLRAPVYKGIELADLESVTWEEEGAGLTGGGLLGLGRLDRGLERFE